MTTTGWAVIAVLVVLVFWVVITYNRLRTSKNQVDNAFAQIDVQLKRRHDLIPNLVEVARGYLQHEASTLEAVTRARTQAVGAADKARQQPGGQAAMGALMVAEQALGAQMGRLFALSEAYPELKADQRMKSLSEEIASTENRIGFARQAYNDQILDFNNSASQFPDLIVARLLGFVQLDMLASTQSEAERAVPQVRF